MLDGRADLALATLGAASPVPPGLVGGVLLEEEYALVLMPGLSLYGAPDGTEITALGPDRPTRRVGYVTTPEQARSRVVQALIRELRAERARAAVSDSRKSE